MVLQMEWIPWPEEWSKLVSSLPVNSPIVALNLVRTRMTGTEYCCYHGTSCWSWQGRSDGHRHRPCTDASMLIYLRRNQKIRVKMFAFYCFTWPRLFGVIVLSVSGADTSRRKVSVSYTANQQISDHNRSKIMFQFFVKKWYFVL